MGVTKKDKLLVETICDLCGASMGTSLIDPGEYGDWLKHTTDLLTFTITAADPLLLNYPTTRNALLCWECIRARGLVKEYDKRLNDLTYPKDKA
jgi:hypothetical protein